MSKSCVHVMFIYFSALNSRFTSCPSDFCFHFLCVVLGNHSQISRAIVAIRVLDINDNAPEFPTEYEAFLCENGKPGQVRHRRSPMSVVFAFVVFLITCSLCWIASSSLSWLGFPCRKKNLNKTKSFHFRDTRMDKRLKVKVNWL